MHVLHLTETWKGGCGVYVSSLIRAQLKDADFSAVTLLCSRQRAPDSLPLPDHPKLRVLRYDSSRSPLAMRKTCRQLKALLGEAQPDLLHAHSTFAGLYAHFVNGGTPVVFCAHGWSFTQELPYPKKIFFASAERWLARSRDATYHISEDERREALRWRVRSKQDVVIHNGVRAPENYDAPIPLELNEKHLNLCFLGRFDRQKGVDQLLQAFARVDRADLRLFLIGGYDRDSADNIDQQIHDDARVTNLGWIENEMIDAYLSRFDAVVVPSRWEGFGLVVTEAMRNGVPAIISNRGGMPEQIEEGKNGYLFDLEAPAALPRILENLDKGILRQMAPECRSIYQTRFTDAIAFAKVKSLYTTVFELRRTQPTHRLTAAPTHSLTD